MGLHFLQSMANFLSICTKKVVRATSRLFKGCHHGDGIKHDWSKPKSRRWSRLFSLKPLKPLSITDSSSWRQFSTASSRRSQDYRNDLNDAAPPMWKNKIILGAKNDLYDSDSDSGSIHYDTDGKRSSCAPIKSPHNHPSMMRRCQTANSPYRRSSQLSPAGLFQPG